MTKATASAKSGSSAPASDIPSSLDRVIELGIAIVRSFEREDDLLSQWMAHRLAELMEAAEHGRTRADRGAAAEQASDLILQLWRHRHQWPGGWPPGELGTLFERLHEIETTSEWQRHWRTSYDHKPSWASALTELDRLGAAERHIAMSAALVSMDDDELQAWLHASATAGEDDELLDRLEQIKEVARRRLSKRADPRVSRLEESEDELDPIALQKGALRELVDLASRRTELLKSIAEAQGLPFPRAARGKRASLEPKAPDLG